jgi:hypothetical protein
MAKPVERPARRQLPTHLQGGPYSHGSTPGAPIPAPAQIEAPRTGPMTGAEAHAADQLIQADDRRLGERLVEFHDRFGWKALHFPSWKAYVETRTTRTTSAINKQMQAARARATLNLDKPDHSGQDGENFPTLSGKAFGTGKRKSDSRARAEGRKARKAARASDPDSRAVDDAIADVVAEREPGCDDDRDETPPRVHVCPGCALRFTEAEEPPDA